MSELGEQIIQAVRDIADERSIYTHGGPCRYVFDGEPACLVGHALWRVGLIDADFERSCWNREGVIDLLDGEALGVKCDWPELQWLGAVQDAQDARIAWGEAVDIADAQKLIPA